MSRAPARTVARPRSRARARTSSRVAQRRGSTTSATPWWPSKPASGGQGAALDLHDRDAQGRRVQHQLVQRGTALGHHQQPAARRRAAKASSTGRRPATSSSSSPSRSAGRRAASGASGRQTGRCRVPGATRVARGPPGRADHRSQRPPGRATWSARRSRGRSTRSLRPVDRRVAGRSPGGVRSVAASGRRRGGRAGLRAVVATDGGRPSAGHARSGRIRRPGGRAPVVAGGTGRGPGRYGPVRRAAAAPAPSGR